MLEHLWIGMGKDLFVQFLESVQVLLFSRICTFANLGETLVLSFHSNECALAFCYPLLNI